MLRKLLLIKGLSSYGAVRVFVDELKKGFENLGISCELFDANDYDQGDGFFTKDLYPALSAALEKKPDFIFSAGGLLLHNIKRWMKKSGVTIPVLAYYVDHPFWEHERLSFAMDHYYTAFVDENFTRYASTYYHSSKAVATVQQAGIQSGLHEREFVQRKNAVVFLGSYSDSANIEQEIKNGSGSVTGYIEKMLAYGKEHPTETVENIVLKIFSGERIVLPQERVPVILSSLKMVETYLRSFFREKCIKTLLENEIELHIYGDGWERFPVKNKNLLHTYPSVAYRNMADIMTEYRFALNVLPWAKAGFHDRIATSLLNGCFCFSDTSTYLEAEHLDGEKMATYHLGDEQELADRVKYYMGSDDLAGRIAGEGKKYAMQYHTWEKRAEEFVEVMNGRHIS